ncbi:MAG: hypothetical protein Q8R18_04390 [bacterium]|nr:hypothetical protein [bacterium]
MQRVGFYNGKEKKELFHQLKEQFGVTEEPDVLFFENSQDKIFVLSKDFAQIDTQGMRINNSGMYFAKKEREGLRLSIEGAQLLDIRKNIIPVNKAQAELWMKGGDIPFEGNSGFVILQHENDILGCGMLKNDLLRNMVPKERRLHSITASQDEEDQ